MGMTLEGALQTLGFSSVTEFKNWANTASTQDIHAMGEMIHLFISPKSGGGE